MQSLSFFFFMLGIIFITIAYMDSKSKSNVETNNIEYRFVPRTLYDEQIESVDLSQTYSDMFSDVDPIFT